MNPGHTDLETRLRHALDAGAAATFGPEEAIPADDLRRVILGLAPAAPTVAAAAQAKPPAAAGGSSAAPAPPHCAPGRFAISIHGGRVVDRLELDAVLGEDGGPLAALAFEGTEFRGGFSG